MTLNHTRNQVVITGGQSIDWTSLLFERFEELCHIRFFYNLAFLGKGPQVFQKVITGDEYSVRKKGKGVDKRRTACC